MQKIVISEQFGGYGWSNELYEELGYEGQRDYAKERETPRDDPALVAAVEKLGTEKASNRFSELHVIEIPDGVKWHVSEYDGYETLHEDHRTWNSEGCHESKQGDYSC